jgi:signal transduction histidine kinase
VVASISEVLALVLMILSSLDPKAQTNPYWGAAAVIGIVFPAIGAIIVSRYPGNVLAWILCAMGLTGGVSDLASNYATYALVAGPGTLPGVPVAAWVGSVVGTVAFSLLAFIPLLFPDGHLPSRRWQPVAWLFVVMIALVALRVAFAPGPFADFLAVTNPLGIEGARPVFELISAMMSPGSVPFLLAGVAAMVVRFRRSRGDERQQLKWFTYAVFLIPISLIGNGLFPDFAWLMGGVSMALIPIAIGVAILKYRLYDIDLIINRTLVYGTLTACVIGIYVLVVGYLGAVFRVERNLLVSLAATGIVAVIFAPLRERLQRGVNRLMYGERDDPYAVISRLGQRLESTLAPNAVLPAVAGMVREALRLPYAAIEVERDGGFEPAAVSGEQVADPLRLPLVYGGETVGRLVLGVRPGEKSFSSPDRRLLDDLARQIGVAVHAWRLTDEALKLSADLQRSRERLVTAREEERRRLRRDLHDGLGPQLASLTMRAEAARDLVGTRPDHAEALLGDLMDGAQEAVADVRRLVYALRPPALDALGLVGALRSHASRQEGGLRVEVESPDELPPLPAAVEVAAYRIALEALNNAFRHADARCCAVRLALGDGALELVVSDDGQGIGAERGAGVGLHSMRERAEELGGTFAVGPGPARGTRVEARLPLSRGRADETQPREA